MLYLWSKIPPKVYKTAASSEATNRFNHKKEVKGRLIFLMTALVNNSSNCCVTMTTLTHASCILVILEKPVREKNLSILSYL